MQPMKLERLQNIKEEYNVYGGQILRVRAVDTKCSL